MSSLLALATAGLLANALGAAPVLGTGDVQVEAGSITYDVGTGRYVLEDGVVLRRGAVTLRSRSARLDPRTGDVDAAGDVLLTDASRVIAAEGIHAVLGGAFEAQDVVAFLKDRPARLGNATSIDEARRTGPNRLSLSGKQVEGDEHGGLRLADVRLTLCDCGGAAPSWELRARRATVVPGHHATLSWPVLYVTPRILFVDHPVPVLPLPWIYVPLGERQSGLLLPQVLSSGASGWTVAEPIFVTLGQSADLTLTPEYAFGRATLPTVRGPGASLELRWIPAERAAGRVELAWLQDLDAERFGDGARGGHGARVALTGVHDQRFSADTHLRLDLALYGDPLYGLDFTGDVLARGATYRRSDVLLSHRLQEDSVVELDASYLEPLAPSPRLLPELFVAGTPASSFLAATSPGLGVSLAGVPFGTFGSDVPVFHRLPALDAMLVPVPIAGPVTLAGEAGIARFSPIHGATNHAGVDRLAPGDRGWFLGAADPAEASSTWIPGERLAVTRGDLRAELAAPFLVADTVSLRPYVRGAAMGYAFDQDLSARGDVWGLTGAVASTELSRNYDGIVHAITPAVEWRLGSSVLGTRAQLPAYDALDRVPDEQPLVLPASVETGGISLPVPVRHVLTAAPDGVFQQLRLSLANRVAIDSAELLRLTLGQDLDLRRGRAAESFVDFVLALGPLRATTLARFLAFGDRPGGTPPAAHPSFLDSFTEFRADVLVQDARGDGIHAGLFAVGQGASGDLVAGTDALFDLRPAPFDALAQGGVGARVVIGPATLGYDALFPGRPVTVGRCSGSGTRTLAPLEIQQHVGSFLWDSPCRCFRIRALVRVDDCGGISGSGGFEISRLGAGAFR